MKKFIKIITSEDIQTRAKSLAWRTGAMALVMTLQFIAENLSLFSLPNEWIVVIGLVLGEITKLINNKYQFTK